MNKPEFIKNQEFLRKIIGKKINLANPQSLIGRAKMTKSGYYQVRRSAEIFAKSLGFDYSCITIKHNMKKKHVTAEIVQHKNDPIVRYEYFLERITLDMAFV